MLYSRTTRGLLRHNTLLKLPRIPSFLSIPLNSQTSLPRRRALTNTPASPKTFFEYTSGSWLVNHNLRLKERKHEFNDHELRRLAAQSVGRQLHDVDTMEKLDEGGFNRIFLITMHDGFQMIARVPYPITVPKFYAVASEVATMNFLRAHDLPIPQVYGYDPMPDNPAQTEYIFMEFVKGTKFADVWLELKEADLASVLRQLVELESRLMSISFPAGGSLYYVDDLEKLAGKEVGMPIPLINGERFCVGPDVRIHMWYGRRSQLKVDRGPYRNTADVLAATARKEIAYLERFGQPLLPFQRGRREAYEFKKQSPLDHIQNLQRYLLMAPLLIPDNPSFQAFCIRHPDPQPGNIMLSSMPDSGELRIVSLIDWQHAVVLPRVLQAGIPKALQNHGDSVSEALAQPSLPPNFNEMDEPEQLSAFNIYHARLIHFHYAMSTARHNKAHHDALWNLEALYLCRLFCEAVYPWEGETHDFKALLIDVTERWARLAGPDVPCPVKFDPDDVSRTKAFSERLKPVDETIQSIRHALDYGQDTWTSNDRFEEVKALTKRLKEQVALELPEGEARDQYLANWLLDDMDEDDYM